MNIDVLDFIKKKVSKKKVHLVFEQENFYDDGEQIEFLKPVSLEGELSLVGDVVELEGRVVTEVSLPCSRCLASFKHNVDIQIHERFSVNPDNKDEDEIIFIDSDTIDVTDVIKNNILLSLPIKKLCKDDCKGLCQHCGTNLNNADCNCSLSDVDPRLSKLKELFSAD
jgi:uncharacterized protein